MGAGASLPANMQWIESNQGFIAVKEALGLAGAELENKLCYHKGDEMVILKKFMEMDRNGDGQLDLKEFMRKNKEHTDRKHPHDEFLYRFFGIIETNDERAVGIDPLVFFVCLHAFLVQDEDSQVSFCFHMFDSDHNRVLDHTEFSQLCRLAQPQMTDAEIAAQLDAVDAGNKDQVLDLDEVMGKKHRLTFQKLLWPVLRTADDLREKLGGEEYWQRRRHALKRAKKMRPNFEKGDLVGLFHDNLSPEDKQQMGLVDEASEWTRYDDPATGHAYWCNNITGISTWEEPEHYQAYHGGANDEVDHGVYV